ncbi:phosphoserine phosphatase [Chromatium weissei]|nr:phosphoserine phosphatase [Chromatium weissei]
MALTLFDLDNTLLAGDSDYLWGCFLAQQGIVDGAMYERENAQFYHDYHAGTLDIAAFLRFSLRPLREHSRSLLETLRQQFVTEHIEPIMLPAARALIAAHQAAGDTLVIITATNAFVTAPIAERFGVAHLIATEPAEINGQYTGEVAGVPAFREGKVTRLEQWLAAHGGDWRDSTFYSDSHNDLPLLERVTRPIAVDPDAQLRAVATARGWQIVSLRDENNAQ